MSSLRRLAFLLFCLANLVACADNNLVQRVSSESRVFGTVEVIPLTPASAASANAIPYEPRQLPAAFSVDGGSNNLPLQEVAANWPTDNFVPPYRIGVGDVLLLSRSPSFLSTGADTRSTDLTIESRLQVTDTGTVLVSDLGEIPVRDLTLGEATQLLVDRFNQEAIDPRFDLSILEFNARTASVTGIVGEPKLIPITLSPRTVSDALALAGDVSTADDRGVRLTLVRDNTRFEVGLTQFKETPSFGGVPLRDGDMLMISASGSIDDLRTRTDDKRAEDAEFRTRFNQSRELGAIAQDYVYIAGEVGVQRRFPMPFNTNVTLADALFESAGVANGTGNPAEIYVIRMRSADRVQAFHLSAGNAIDLVVATTLDLRPSDFVFVSERPIAAWDRIITTLFPQTVFDLFPDEWTVTGVP